MIHLEAIASAHTSVNQARIQQAEDNHLPLFHATPGVNWINDPNGLIYFRGEYHVFYQFNPYGVSWGNMHWGHMKTKDFIHWQHLPIALAPSEDYDQDGCFSGSAIEHEGRLLLFYTSNKFTSPIGLPDDLLQQQCLAISEDGVHFDKHARNPIILAPPEAIGQTNHFRDPKVWQQEGKWYMVLGTKYDGRGKVVLYSSSDFLSWQFVKVLTESDGTLGHMYECPDFFRIGSTDVLIFCPEGASRLGEARTAGYVQGAVSDLHAPFVHGEFHRLDHGFDYYAPQTFLDERGRRILIGWMPMDGVSLDKSWSGCMTYPREILCDEQGRLRFRPLEELKLLRKETFSLKDYVLTERISHAYHVDEPHRFEQMMGDCFELDVVFDMQATTAKCFGINICASLDGQEKTVIQYDVDHHQLSFDRTYAGIGEKGICECKIEADHDQLLRVHIFVDRSVVELYVNDGEMVMSGYIFPSSTSQFISLFTHEGSASINRLEFWPYGN